MRKLKVGMICVLFMLITAAVFAGGGSQASTTAGGVTKLTAVARMHPLTKQLDSMQWLNDVQKATNVSVEWEQISSGWWGMRGARFASGDIPVMLLGGATDNGDYAIYTGLFEDLAPLIEAYAPNIKKMFAEHPELKALSTQLDGKIYGLPQYKRFGARVASGMYINKVWLDRVGKKVPTTWDELKDVLIAFRDQDANGNGDRNDEIPFDINGISPQVLLGSLGLPISDGAGGGYFAENGQIKNFFVDDRFKTLVTFLRDLYAERLIGTEVFTQDYAQWQSTGRNDGKIAKVGFSIGWSAGDRFGELYEQYVAVPPLKYSAASTSTVYYSWDNEAQNYADNKFSLSSKAKENEKIAAIKFIDQFYDPIISMQVYAGGMNPVDNCIRQNPDGTYEYISSDEGGKSGWESGFMDQGGYYIADYLPLINPNAELETERAVYKDQEKLYNSKTNIYPQTFMKYTTADTQTMAMSDANIANLTSQWALWVVGQGNIETGWNAYVKSINDAGLQQNLQIRQRAFDTYVKQL